MPRSATRLRASLALIASLALTAVAAGNARAAPPPTPRNVLLLIADDLGVDASDLYPATGRLGRAVTVPPAPPVPNLRALAARGVLFRNAWADPWCSPTRATLFTGRYGFRTGLGEPIHADVDMPAPVLQPSEFGIPRAFAARPDLGYQLAHIGKWHLSRGDDDPNLFGWPYFAGPQPTLAMLPDYYDWPKTINGVTARTTKYATTDNVDEALGRIGAARAVGRPWFVWLAFSDPHAPYQLPPPGLYAPSTLPDPRTVTPGRYAYEAMVEALDAEIGRLLEGVDLAATTVVFLGDNGTPGEVTAPPYDRTRAKGKVYEGGARVPLLVAGAGVDRPGRIDDALVNTVDLYPTILELAGIDPASVVPRGVRTDGVTMLPYIAGRPHPAPRAFAYAEAFDQAWDEGWQRAIRDQRHKLIRRQPGLGAVRELYDLKADPMERNDLLKTTLTAAQKKALRGLEGRMAALLATR